MVMKYEKGLYKYMLRLQFNNAIEDIVDIKVIEEIKKWENIIVFGAGDSGEWVVNLLKHYGIAPKCYCDNYSGKWGGIKNDLKIMSFEDAIACYSNSAICIASMWSEEILQQILNYDSDLEKRTWDLLTSMSWETSDHNYISTESAFIKSNLAEFEKLYEYLADKRSKDTLEGILNYRLTRNKEFLYKIRSREQIYFDKTIIKFMPLDKEIIDGGGFDGDTVEAIIANFSKKGVQLKIHCYEPGKENCKKIENKCSDWQEHMVILHKTALWNKSGKKLHFNENGLSGKLGKSDSDIANNSVITECIDDFGYKSLGFIKMDIEGAEREALSGARKTIRNYRPILAICAYHLQDDLLVLPKLIRTMECDYLLYLRHYMNSSGDTILYGIPK